MGRKGRNTPGSATKVVYLCTRLQEPRCFHVLFARWESGRPYPGLWWQTRVFRPLRPILLQLSEIHDQGSQRIHSGLRFPTPPAAVILHVSSNKTLAFEPTPPHAYLYDRFIGEHHAISRISSRKGYSHTVSLQSISGPYYEFARIAQRIKPLTFNGLYI